MDRKKQLLMEYKYRKPEMGIVSYKCIDTQESFLGISKDTKATMNGNTFRLDANSHYNKKLQALWNQYGKENFEITVLKVLPYKEEDLDKTSIGKNDYTEELETLLIKMLNENEKAMSINP